MKILIVGSGGREHALAWACHQSNLNPQITCAPGNGGTDLIGRNVDIPAEDVSQIEDYVRAERFDLTIIGPEAPAVAGLADRLMKRGFRVFGPSAGAAQIEGSKAFAKKMMVETGIPTATSETFTDLKSANDYIKHHGAPIVVKASGLAAGKGAVVCETVAEALKTAKAMLESKEFGDAGSEIVVEDLLEGEEVSMTAICDGTDYLLLPPSRDHKRIFDGDKGPNTGGMGAKAPLDDRMNQLYLKFADATIPPLLKALSNAGTPFRGTLYPGLMVSGSEFKVLEFNARFGDPEAQVLIPLFGLDLLEVMAETAEGSLGSWMTRNQLSNKDWMLSHKQGFASTVVAASGGYPGAYSKGMKISGLPEESDDLVVFHAGTKRKDAEFHTSGGRVLAVTGLGESLTKSLEIAYEGINQIRFEGMQYRHDIGRKNLT